MEQQAKRQKLRDRRAAARATMLANACESCSGKGAMVATGCGGG